MNVLSCHMNNSHMMKPRSHGVEVSRLSSCLSSSQSQLESVHAVAHQSALEQVHKQHAAKEAALMSRLERAESMLVMVEERERSARSEVESVRAQSVAFEREVELLEAQRRRQEEYVNQKMRHAEEQRMEEHLVNMEENQKAAKQVSSCRHLSLSLSLSFLLVSSRNKKLRKRKM